MLFLADIGLPMIVLQMPILVILLVPVIAVETAICWRLLQQDKKKTLSGVVLANLITTLIGFPLVWGFFVMVELVVTQGGRAYGLHTFWQKVIAVTVQAPWLVPSAGETPWMPPTAGMILLIPSFFASVYIERWFCRWYWKYEDRTTLNKAFWKIHGASYALLFGVGLCLLAYSLQHRS